MGKSLVRQMSRKTAVKSPMTNVPMKGVAMKIVERASRVGNGVGRGTWVKGSKATVAHNPTPSTERGKRRAAKREAAKAAADESK